MLRSLLFSSLVLLCLIGCVSSGTATRLDGLQGELSSLAERNALVQAQLQAAIREGDVETQKRLESTQADLAGQISEKRTVITAVATEAQQERYDSAMGILGTMQLVLASIASAGTVGSAITRKVA